MRRSFWLALLGLLWAGPAAAQCLGIGGVASTPQLGVTCSLPLTQQTISITGTVAGATQIIAAVTGQKIYVTSINMFASTATSTITFSYGTGTNCGTGTTALTGAMIIAASSAGLTVGDGNGVVLVVPASNALCVTIATQTAPGFLAYAQF